MTRYEEQVSLYFESNYWMASSSSISDIISELPNNIIEHILMFLSHKDAVRTSILSSKWRYKWLTVPQLVFDYPCNHKLSTTENVLLIKVVYQALLLHQGPLRKFSFSISDLDNCSSDINHWLHCLSNNRIEDFRLRIWTGGYHKLPCHFYSFQQLRHLNLYNCVFKPPSTFRGFDKLVSLEFRKVLFAPERFGIFISSCPLLERLILEDCPHFFCLRITCPNLKCLSFDGSFDSVNLKNTPLLHVVSIALNAMPETTKYLYDRSRTSNLVEIFSSIPAIEDLSIQHYSLKFFAIGGLQNRLLRTLDHLRVLHLSDMCFQKKEEVSCAICLIRSSPNLEKLTIRALADINAVMEPMVEQHLTLQNFSDCSLHRLKVVKMQLIGGKQLELEFMKFLLAVSTTLEKFEILPVKEKGDNKGFQILRELIRYRRASAKAEIIYLDPELGE